MNFEFVSLSDDTNEVIVFLAGYISRSLKKKLKCSDCMMFLERDTVSSAYFETVNRGKLTRPSSAVIIYTQSAFAALELTEKMILASSAPEKVLAKLVLDEVCTLWGYNFICDLHEKS